MAKFLDPSDQWPIICYAKQAEAADRASPADPSKNAAMSESPTSIEFHRKAGRPTKWNAGKKWLLDAVVELIKSDSQAGRLPRNLKTDSEVCRFVVGSPDADHIRTMIGLNNSMVSAGRLQNIMSEERKSLRPLRK